jgi:hypothetical protein
MSNHITIELCAEDRQRIDELIAFAGLIASEMKSSRPLQLQSIDENGIRFGTAAEEHPVDAVAPHGEPEPAAEPVADPEPVYKVTKDDIMAKVQPLAAPNNPKREQAKAIVKSYGAKVSDIPEDKYAEVMDKLVELEG